jgi:hypothetical protein
MTERYLPPSEFLQAVIADELAFGEGPFGEANLGRLIYMTQDAVTANRDWAVMLLSQLELDRPGIRKALIASSIDPAYEVRVEAILGLARLDPVAALPLLARELAGEQVSMPLLEAARIVADPSLLSDLYEFAGPSDDGFLDEWVQDAITACLCQSN